MTDLMTFTAKISAVLDQGNVVLHELNGVTGLDGLDRPVIDEAGEALAAALLKLREARSLVRRVAE